MSLHKSYNKYRFQMMLGISFSELNLKMNQISTYESCNANRNAKKKKKKNGLLTLLLSQCCRDTMRTQFTFNH